MCWRVCVLLGGDQIIFKFNVLLADSNENLTEIMYFDEAALQCCYVSTFFLCGKVLRPADLKAFKILF